MDFRGLAPGWRISPQILGRRGSRLVIDASHVQKVVDSAGLKVFRLKSVFTDPSTIFLGFGRPNAYLVVPRSDGSGWDKFAAFMFWRQKSFVTDTEGKAQAGVLFELRGLSAEAIGDIRQSMHQLAGRRTATCANINSRVLTTAGFTSGGKPIKRVYRPTKLASLIWRQGLEYRGQAVAMRVIQTDGTVFDHFVSVWRKELTSLCRLAKHLVKRGPSHQPLPELEESSSIEVSIENWHSASLADIGISRPSLLGSYLGFLWGERPIFYARPKVPLTAPELTAPLRPFPGQLSRTTKIKKYVLFSRPVVRLIRRHLVAAIETYENIPARGVAKMLRLSTGPDRHTAFVYNLVMTGTDIRITRLENRNGKDHKFLNWILAKHVLVAGYDPDVRFSGELWCYLEANSGLTICLNDSSGTYKPDPPRLAAAAQFLSQTFEVPVLTQISR